MTDFHLQRFWSDDEGGVAASYGVIMLGLIAVAGVGFDYARMASMDSELQQASDQAALAAATQLTGKSGAITNATTQASSQVKNVTLLANDGDSDGTAVTVTSLVFYPTRADAEADTNPTTSDASARFVKVTVKARKARYALTPVVGALISPSISASATAGLGGAVCNVPPLMMCNPTANPSVFNLSDFQGKGIRLKAKGSGASWAPGDFGFLDVGAGASDLGKLIAYGSPPGDCVDVTDPNAQPGAIASVIDDFNTRFDIYENGDNINCFSGALCPPSDNSRKDVVRPSTAGTALKDCGFSNDLSKDTWSLTPDPYRPVDARTYAQQIASGDKTGYPDVMGYPRDICHAHSETGDCSGGRIGNGVWDINAYWESNYGTAYASQVNGKAAPTRYEVYLWERTNAPASRTLTLSYNQGASTKSGTYVDSKAPICRTGSAPAGSTVDRRVVPVAVVDCTGLSGSGAVTPLAFLDVFLVEPSLSRKVGSTVYTQKGDIYVEPIRVTTQGTGGTAPQFVLHEKAFLVK